MTSRNDTEPVVGQATGRPAQTRRFRGLVGTGFLATLVAMVTTAVAAALAQGLGVDFAVSNSEETIPASGIAVVTGFFSVVGVLMAVALRR